MTVNEPVTLAAERTLPAYSIISLFIPAKILFFFPHKRLIALIVYSDGLNLIREIVGFQIDNNNLYPSFHNLTKEEH